MHMCQSGHLVPYILGNLQFWCTLLAQYYLIVVSYSSFIFCMYNSFLTKQINRTHIMQSEYSIQNTSVNLEHLPTVLTHYFSVTLSYICTPLSNFVHFPSFPTKQSLYWHTN